MKNVWTLLLLTTVFATCKREDVSTNEVAATLDGYDPRMCPCCGGQYMRVDATRYRFFELPTSIDPSIDLGFDRSFWIRFKPYEGGCSQSKDLITITSIRKR